MGEVSTSCWRNDKVWGRWEELESCSDHNLSLENTVGFNSIDKSCKSFPNTLKHEERLSYILYAYLWRENVLRYHTALFGQSRLWRSDVVAQTVKNPPAMWEIWVWSLGWEDRLEEGMATHSSIPAWRIPMDRGAWRAIAHRVANSWTWLNQLSVHTHMQALICQHQRQQAKALTVLIKVKTGI